MFYSRPSFKISIVHCFILILFCVLCNNTYVLFSGGHVLNSLGYDIPTISHATCATSSVAIGCHTAFLFLLPGIKAIQIAAVYPLVLCHLGATLRALSGLSLL